MAGLGPAIHVFTYGQDVDARVKPAHDGASDSTSSKNASRRLREEGDDVTSAAVGPGTGAHAQENFSWLTTLCFGLPLSLPSRRPTFSVHGWLFNAARSEGR